MADSASVEAYYGRHIELYQYLMARQEVSFAADFSETFTRGLVLAIASYFEHEITEILTDLPRRRAAGDPILTSMIMRQVVSRKYHTYFDWDKLKPGPFWALLGEDFKAKAAQDLKDNEEFDQAVRAFLELGQIRAVSTRTESTGIPFAAAL